MGSIKKIKILQDVYAIEDDSKYAKPDGGIPKSDLAADVQASLNKANSAVTTAELNGYVKKENADALVKISTTHESEEEGDVSSSVTFSMSPIGQSAITAKINSMEGEGMQHNSTIDMNNRKIRLENLTSEELTNSVTINPSSIELKLDRTEEDIVEADLILTNNNIKASVHDMSYGEDKTIIFGQDLEGEDGVELHIDREIKVNLNGNRVQNIGKPMEKTDAATKDYVDQAVSSASGGGSDEYVSKENADAIVAITNISTDSEDTLSIIETAMGFESNIKLEATTPYKYDEGGMQSSDLTIKRSGITLVSDETDGARTTLQLSPMGVNLKTQLPEEDRTLYELSTIGGVTLKVLNEETDDNKMVIFGMPDQSGLTSDSYVYFDRGFGIDMNNNRVMNLPDPKFEDEAVSKRYVDKAVADAGGGGGKGADILVVKSVAVYREEDEYPKLDVPYTEIKTALKSMTPVIGCIQREIGDPYEGETQMKFDTCMFQFHFDPEGEEWIQGTFSDRQSFMYWM